VGNTSIAEFGVVRKKLVMKFFFLENIVLVKSRAVESEGFST